MRIPSFFLETRTRKKKRTERRKEMQNDSEPRYLANALEDCGVVLTKDNARYGGKRW